MDRRLNGLNPLAYMGNNSITPPDLLIDIVSPTVNDSKNINIGTLWLVFPEPSPSDPKVVTEVWVLSQLVGNAATWVQIYPVSSSGVSNFPCDSGTAVSSAGILNTLGDSANISTTGTGNTVELKLSNGTNGQVLIGGSTHPKWASITSSSIAITSGPNSLNLDVTNATVMLFVTDSGNAVPAAGALTIHGGTNIATSGSGSTVTIQFDNNIIIPGTVIVDTLTRGVVQSNSSGLLSSSEGTNGQLLISSPIAADWNNLTSSGGTINITNGSNSINVETAGGMSTLGVGNYAFLALQTTNLTNVTGDNTIVQLGALAALTVQFDVGGNVYPGNGAGSPATFTAPATGYYYFQIAASIFNSADATAFTMSVVTPNRTYRTFFNLDLYSGVPNTGNPSASLFSTMADMTVGDVATFTIQANFSGSAKAVSIYSNLGLANSTLTSISGFKIG